MPVPARIKKFHTVNEILKKAGIREKVYAVLARKFNINGQKTNNPHTKLEQALAEPKKHLTAWIEQRPVRWWCAQHSEIEEYLKNVSDESKGKYTDLERRIPDDLPQILKLCSRP